MRMFDAAISEARSAACGRAGADSLRAGGGARDARRDAAPLTSNLLLEKFDAAIAEAMNQHPDAHLFTNLRGAGDALAPRLLCAFGSQRDRWNDADELGSFSGIAPVTIKSGKARGVYRRRACPKYLRQTFHEFADWARRFARGAKPDTACFATAG